MKSFLILLLLASFSVNAGVFYYGSGEAVNLENVIGYDKNGQKIIGGESIDPTVIGYDAEPGSLLFNTLGDFYIKTATTATTSWTMIPNITDLDLMLPDQTVNAGKFLSTTGTTSFWNDVQVATTATSSNSTLQDYVDQTGNAGLVSGGIVTDNGDGTVDVGSGTGLIRTANNNNGSLVFFDWVGVSSLALTDDAANYIHIDYNAGNPVISVSTLSTVLDNENDQFEIAEIYRDGTTLNISEYRQRAGNIGKYIQQRLYEVTPMERANGLMIGELGTRNISTTAGTVWIKLDRMAISAIDTSVASIFSRYYQDGVGGWTLQSAQTQWDNANYDDGTGVLAAMTASYYSAQYFYMQSDGSLSSIYGWNEYASLSEAEDDTPPSTIPTILQNNTILIGRIVFQNGAAVASSIESPFDQTFGLTAVTSHGELANLTTSDDHTQYALLAGRTGGQVLYGSNTATGTVTIAGTSHGIQGYTHLEPSGGFVTLGTAGGGSGYYFDAEGSLAGSAGLRFRNALSTGYSQLQAKSDTNETLALMMMGSGTGFGTLGVGASGLVARTSSELFVVNDSNNPISFATDVTDVGTMSSTIKAQIAGDGSAIFNFNYDDADFTIRSNTATIAAYNYDAVDESHVFIGDFDIQGTDYSSSPCPTLTTVERDLIAAPRTGSCIYNSTNSGWEQYDGASWSAIGGGGGSGLTDYTTLVVFDSEEDLATNWTATDSTIAITSTGTISGSEEYLWTTTDPTATLVSPIISVPPANRGDAVILTFPHKTSEEIEIDIWNEDAGESLGTFTSDNSSANTFRALFTTTTTTTELTLRLTATATTTETYFNRAVLATAGDTGVQNDIADEIGQVAFFARDADFNGWISALDKTIGDAGSGADYAEGKYRTLYEHIWNLAGTQTATSTAVAGAGFTVINISGSKGSSAGADWAAGNVIVADLTNDYLGSSGTFDAGEHLDYSPGDHSHPFNVSNTALGTANASSSTLLGYGWGGGSVYGYTTSFATLRPLDDAAIGDPDGYTSTTTRPDTTILNPFIRYKNDTVAQTTVTGGGGSEAGVEPPDTYAVVYADDTERYDISLWTTSTSTVSFSTTTSALFGATSFSFINGIGAEDEYVQSPNIATEPGNRDKVNHSEWTYTYTGTDDAIEFIFYNVSDGSVIGSVSAKSTTSPLRISPEGWTPSTAEQVAIRIKVLTGEAAALVFDRGVFSDTPANEINLLITEGARYTDIAGYGSTDTAILRFTNEEYNNTGSLISVVNSAVNGLTVTAIQDCTVHMGFNVAYTSASQVGITLNSTDLTLSVTAQSDDRFLVDYSSTGAANQSEHVGASILLEAGDVLRPHGSKISISTINERFGLTVIATAESPAVVHSSDGSVEEWVDAGAMTIEGVTTNPTKGTIVKDSVWNRRIGDSSELRYLFSQSAGGAAGSGEYLFSLPDNRRFDPDKIDFLSGTILASDETQAYYYIPASGFMLAETSTYLQVRVVPYDETRFRLVLVNENTGSITVMGSSSGTLANIISFSITFTAPIKYWSGSYKSVITPLTETCYIKDVKASGTEGGTFTSGAWQTRDLNTLSGDTSWCSLSTNQFTLPAGKYEVTGYAPGHTVASHQSAIYDISNSAFIAYGNNTYSDTSDPSDTISIVIANLDITETTVYELQHRCSVTKTATGFGTDTSFGSDEVYAQVKITKLLWR